MNMMLTLLLFSALALALKSPSKAVVQRRCQNLCMESLLKDVTFCGVLCSFTTGLSEEQVRAEVAGFEASEARRLLEDSSEDFARELFRAKWAQAAKLGHKFLRTLKSNVEAAREHEDL